MKTKLIDNLNSLKRSIAGLACALVFLSSAAGCGVTEQQLTLAQQTFHYDLMFNIPTFVTSVPSIPCTDAAICVNTLKTVGIVDSRIIPICDPQSHTCAANVSLTVLYTIDESMDPAFTTGIAQSDADSMRDIKLTYGITSTVNVDIDTIDVYLAPGGTRSISSPNAIGLGTVGPIPAMGMLPDGANYLLIPDGTPAHDEYVDFTKHPENPFAVLMLVKTRLQAGDPLPKGGIEVRLVPIVTLLNR